ncbi:uncharacterized protein LOC134528347 isoform X2 [Bacillus rossius redtenbacheri]|uniref:uncharacterized protein LOC134528347 isoform X2 n=1 Tax=Bacillus rossius redtenbacheri TaxID=93214 RepID=UPI002FDE8742
MDNRTELSRYVQELYTYTAVAAAVAVELSRSKETSIDDHLCVLRDRFTAKDAGACVAKCAVQQNVSQDSAYGSQDADSSSSQQNHEQSATTPQQTLVVPETQQDSQTASAPADWAGVLDPGHERKSPDIDSICNALGNLATDSADCRVGAREESRDDQQDVRKAAVENARFIYAIIGLRFAARREAFVPASTVNHFLGAAGSSGPSLLAAADCDVASALVQYHTQRAHEHLLQSMNQAVGALGTLILDPRPRVVRERFNGWENSSEHYVLDNVCSALDFLCDEGGDSSEYVTTCVELVRSFVDKVMEDEDDNKFVMWEQQCGMLLRLLGHRHVCGSALSLLVENIQRLADGVRRDAGLPAPERVQGMHRSASAESRSFYVFSLAEDLLVRYRKIHGDLAARCSEADGSREPRRGARTVDALWRDAFSHEDDASSKLRSSRQLISAWKTSLASAAMTFTNHNAHLLSIYAWSCVDLAKDLQQ